MVRSSWAFLLFVAGIITNAGCTPFEFVDEDDTCTKAKPLPFGVSVKDELSLKVKDISDCKEIKYFKDAEAFLEIKIGTPFEKHDLRGMIIIYDDEGRTVEQKSVDPLTPKYEFSFTVTAQKSYFVDFKITDGNYGYTQQISFKALDPCAKCTDEQECVDKKCRAKDKVCDPECDEELGELCDEGECKYQCDPDCRKRKGYSCEASSGECVKQLKECSPKCKTGFVCNRRTGQCAAKAAGCTKGCPMGQFCQGGRCVVPGGVAPKCPPCAANERCDAPSGKCVPGGVTPPPDGDITGTVTSTQRAPDGTIIYLNRGERHGVKAGTSGTLCGSKITVVNVYPTRSKAKTSATIEAIGKCNSFTIRR